MTIKLDEKEQYVYSKLPLSARKSIDEDIESSKRWTTIKWAVVGGVSLLLVVLGFMS